MALVPGTRLGPYEILTLLGSGGMGEVYRARDTRLDRTVAIKILPEALAADAQFRERFDREARTISQLDHPHICPLYDVGAQDGMAFLVMQCLEGETLAEKLEGLRAKGTGLPLDHALAIAIQVADALDCAHRAGVVHRDLKPGNIFLVRSGGASALSTAKLLDFGLAKAAPPIVGHRFSGAGGAGAADGTPQGAPYNPTANLTSPPTMTTPLTGQGTIIGTFQYMSPEQLEGKDVDARADTFAFGAVLFEMVTGRRAFQGKTQFTVMGAILEHDPPPISTVASSVPPALDRVVQKCLAKDPAKRWQSVADLADELRWIAEQAAAGDRLPASAASGTAPVAAVAAPPRAGRQWTMAIASGAVCAAVAVLATWLVLHQAPQKPQPMRFSIVPPATEPFNVQGFYRNLAISPDGTHVVYIAGNESQLMVRAIDQLDAVPLRGITGAAFPFISPDGRWVGFFFTGPGGELKKVSITGGPPITLCRYQGNARGASWGPDDTIVFATNDGTTGLLSVPAGGGEPKVLTKADAAHGEQDHLFPSVLPGGRAVLFTISAAGGADNAQVAVLDVKTGQRKTLVRGGSDAVYVDPSTSTGSGQAGSGQAGYLVYASAGTLRAVRFDPTRLEVLSDPVPVVEQVTTLGTGAADFRVSQQGTLVYVPGASNAGAVRSLVWVNRQGREEPINAPPRNYVSALLSPDGTRIALDIRDQESDIWVWDLGRQTLTRLTFDPAPDQYPIWTPDGRRIVFGSARTGVVNLHGQAADGTGTVERLITSPNPQVPNSFSPDGKSLVVQEISPKTGTDLMLLKLDGTRRIEPLIQTTFGEFGGEISPDGQWLAYDSIESGRPEVYVRPFPKVDSGRWQISTGGGSRPAWSRTGRELFYLGPNTAMMAVAVQPAPTFNAGNPSKLFDGRGMPDKPAARSTSHVTGNGS